MDAKNELMPPIEKNRHETGIELIWERIQIAIEQMPVPVGADDDRRLEAAEAKMWEVLAALDA